MSATLSPDSGGPDGHARERKADALAGALRREAAGRLTVFLGAAPGVGKTYAMLQRARELQRQGVDVVIGVVETHGRNETSALVDGIECIPKRHLEYLGRGIEELDLDAVLRRRPTVALIDELAHRNAPGSRHERRWQDVLELLDDGIDVYTTLNIQHLESLNDVVQQITGVRVRETVPDGIFERLRDIRLVDLPPRELIERLRQGKVYVPEQADHALQAFFTPGNLAALRELAMQTVADVVDVDRREVQAASGASARTLRRHVLVAVDGGEQTDALVRAGARIADRRGAPWTVVTVDTGTSGASAQLAPAANVDRPLTLDNAFALARKLGASTSVRYGDDVATVLLDEATTRDAATLVLGTPRRRRYARLRARSTVEQLLDRDAGIELVIFAGRRPPSKPAWQLPSATSTRLTTSEAALAVGATAVTVTLAWLGERYFGLTDLSMIFIMAVLLVAARTQMTAAVVTSILCFLAYNFFFIEPRFTFYIGAYPGVATVTIFLVTALVAGRLASRLRSQLLALRAANSHALLLQGLGRELASATDEAAVVRAGQNALAAALGAVVWFALDKEPRHHDFDDRDDGAATWCRRHGKPAGRFTETLGSARWLFLPMARGGAIIGVVGLRFPKELKRIGIEQQRLAEAMIADIAEAVVRTRLVTDLAAARMSEETERLRSALLSSVSHDLRSPLASIIGAADSLAAYLDAMPVEERQSLIAMIAQEGHRLDRYIQNLLDMTRLGHEGLTLARDWIGVDELIGSATSRLARYAPGARFEVHVEPGLPLLNVHPALIEQALFNVLENAWKFSPAEAPIRVEAASGDGVVHIDVSDRGPGIPEVERTLVFDMFHCVEGGDRNRHGSGLGLAIVKAILGAHMGTVEALPGPGGIGSTVRMTLPAPPQPEENDEP